MSNPLPVIVMTLLVRDEEDIIEDNIWYHYYQGVNSFIVMDNRSIDATPNILSRLSDLLPIEYIRQEEDDYNQSAWVTMMARRAASQYNADWVINSDADEFWHSSDSTLREAIHRLPANVGSVSVARINAVPVFTGADPLTSSAHPRFSRVFDRNSTNNLGRPLPTKILHRASDHVVVAQGNHSVTGVDGLLIKCPELTIFHYPYRRYRQYYQKIKSGGQAYERNTNLPTKVGSTWRIAYTDLKEGRLPRFWDEISYESARAEVQTLQRTLRRETCIEEAIILADGVRAELIRKKAALSYLLASLSMVEKRETEIVEQLNNFTPADVVGRPLYQNVSFFLSGMRRHLAMIRSVANRPDYKTEFDEFRDIVSLFPNYSAARQFAGSSLMAECPAEAGMLAAEITEKTVVLHISCEKYLARARLSEQSFPVQDNEDIVHITVVGQPYVQQECAPVWGFGYKNRILTVPVPDTYEMLHRKVFHAFFLLAALGRCRSVVKIDDNLHLSDETVFRAVIKTAETNRAPCSGRVVGTLRHNMQWHGWHIDKCTDKAIEHRGYPYPLPRRYPAGGYGYILTQDGLEACSLMYLSMKEFFNMPAVGLEDAFVGHALYAANLEITNLWNEQNLLALPGLKPSVS